MGCHAHPNRRSSCVKSRKASAFTHALSLLERLKTGRVHAQTCKRRVVAFGGGTSRASETRSMVGKPYALPVKNLYTKAKQISCACDKISTAHVPYVDRSSEDARTRRTYAPPSCRPFQFPTKFGAGTPDRPRTPIQSPEWREHEAYTKKSWHEYCMATIQKPSRQRLAGDPRGLVSHWLAVFWKFHSGEAQHTCRLNIVRLDLPKWGNGMLHLSDGFLRVASVRKSI